ncbi:MAG: spore germination protein [Clostridiales bacterium]|nr:spore germination protein [Clostridiales bacterium]
MDYIYDQEGCVRKRKLRMFDEVEAVLYYFDGMVDAKIINDHIIMPLQRNPLAGRDAEQLCSEVIGSSDAQLYQQFDDIGNLMSLGNIVLFVDGLDQGIVIEAKSWPLRAVDEPGNERVLHGPREGFNESLLQNLAMVRRRLPGINFKAEFVKIGQVTKSTVCICYMDNCVDYAVLAELRDRLERVVTATTMDTNYIAEQVKDNPFTPFRTVGNTERPDIVAAKLLEGRVAVLCDGSPTALTVPYLFMEFFQSNEDYYVNYRYASFQRLLRILGFLSTVALPAFYLALTCFQQDLLPTELAMTISGARKNVPFPSLVEAVILMLAFDILRESGIRSPSNVGQALSVVSSIVLGQAAIEAGFIGSPILIITAFAGVTSMLVPNLIGVTLIYRYALLIITSIMGYWGFFAALFSLLLHICSLESFNISYIAYGYASSQKKTADTFFRDSWVKLKTSPVFPIRGEEPR